MSATTSRRRDYSIVVLGAGGVGKSCLTAQFVQNVWIESYDPTIEDSYRKQVEVDGRQCILEILDTAGAEQFTNMRELYIKSGQGFLLVFSITSLSSLYELSRLREQIIRIKEDETIPLVIVGNKSDLERERIVSRSEAFSISHSWGNTPYYETSARRRGEPPSLGIEVKLMSEANVDEVFIDLCRQIIRKRKIEGLGMDDDADYGYDNEPAQYSLRGERRRRRRRLLRETRCTIL